MSQRDFLSLCGALIDIKRCQIVIEEQRSSNLQSTESPHFLITDSPPPNLETFAIMKMSNLKHDDRGHFYADASPFHRSRIRQSRLAR